MSTSENNAMPSVTNLVDLQGLTAKTGGVHVGDLVWWSLADADVSRADLEAAWQAAGLDPDLLPEIPTPEKALRTAIRQVQVGAKDQLVRLAHEGADQLVYVVKQEAKTADHDTDYATLAKITLDRATGTLRVTGNNDMAGRVQAEFSRMLTTHVSRDVMMTITKCLKRWAAVSLRETGGIYWVPTVSAGLVKALQGAVERIGQSRVYLLPVNDSVDAQRSLGAAAAGSIETELKALQDEIAGFLVEAPRPSTLARRLTAFEELRARADLYRSILGVTLEDLDGQLASMEASVQTMLAGRD
jgi:hypothetical protein